MSDSIWSRLRLPEDTRLAIRLLRIDGKIVVYDEYTKSLMAEDGSDPDRFCEPCNGFFKSSLILRRVHEDAVSIHSHTMRGGCVEYNFECVVTLDGTLLEGTVSDSDAGVVPMEQSFVDELFQTSRIKWDFRERGDYEESESE
jgi:hypothetical protein